MARVPLSVGYRRALRLRCPRCGVGKLFSGLIRMNESCPGCHLTYEREPGYFLGSSYVNYGWTALSMTAAFFILRLVFKLSSAVVMPGLLAYSVIFPLFFHRYARAIWLALDCFFDHTGLPDQPGEPGSRTENEDDSTDTAR